MKAYYNESKTEVRKQVNGSLKPLTEQQVKANQEKYGLNELVEAKKKSLLMVFLEQYKDFLVIILIICSSNGLRCTPVHSIRYPMPLKKTCPKKSEHNICVAGLVSTPATRMLAVRHSSNASIMDKASPPQQSDRQPSNAL